MKLLICTTLLTLTGCIGSVGVDQGEVAVMVKKPYFFGSEGVEKRVYTSGRHWKVWSTTGIVLNVKPVEIDEKFDDLLTADNVPVDFHAYFQSQIIGADTPRLIEQFGTEWYKNNVKEPLRTYIRNFAKSQPVFKLSTNQEVLLKMQEHVKTKLTEFLKSKSIPVKVLRITIGKISPPAAVIKQTELTAAQKQRSRTEIQRAHAELSRKKAEENKALADRAYLVKFGMTVNEYLRLRELEIEKDRIDMARDKRDVTIVMGQVTPFFNVNK